MKYDLSKLIRGLETLNFDISEGQLKKFDTYVSLLLEWNEKMNLTAIVDPEDIMVEHFLDSISILKEIDIGQNSYVIDVGTGAGFPGIPIKIMRPDIKIVLMDSLRKRTEFLEALKDELDLMDVEIIHSRAEDLGRNEGYREQFDIALSRAVASLNILSEYCLPFVKVGGTFVSYKGPAAHEELSNAHRAIKVLGNGKPQIKKVEVPYSPKTHNLICIQKLSSTPKKYPRSPGKVKKSPL